MSAFVMFQFDMTQNSEALHAHGQTVMQTSAPFNAELLVPPTATKALEGDAPSTSVLLKFNSKEDAQAWYSSEAYQTGKQVRDGVDMIVTLLG